MARPWRKRGALAPCRGAFTLVELLVVVAIIALLIGILLPALHQARQATQVTTCAAQIKQIGLGLSNFADENRNRYPEAGGHIAWDVIDPTTGKYAWMQQVSQSQMSGHKDIFSKCPTYPEQSDYHFFLGARAAFVEAGGFAPLFRTRLRYPAAYILSGDLNRHFNEVDADKDDYTQLCAELDFWGEDSYWQPHHQGGLNLLFADGHVSFYTSWNPGEMTYHYASMNDWYFVPGG